MTMAVGHKAATLRESHDREDPIKLVVVVGAAGLHILLPAVEDWLKRQQLSKYAANGPDVCKEKHIGSERSNVHRVTYR